MSRPLVTARPHRVAREDRVCAAPWLMDAAERSPVPDGPIPGWDPTVDLPLSRTLDVDLDGIRIDCELPDDAPISVAVVWGSSGTAIRGGMAFPPHPEASEQKLRIVLAGAELSDRVSIRTQVVLSAAITPTSPIVPHLPGSILWQDERVVYLEGRGSRFPVEWLDFAAAGWLPPDGAWYLDWCPDEPNLPVLGALRLYLNSGHEALRHAVSAAEPDTGQAAIREAVEFDMARTLISRSLGSEEFWRTGEEFDEGTLGSSVTALVRALFPNDSVDGLRARWGADPQRVEVHLQAALRLFRAQRS